jgi:predicted dehydrogenase
MSQRLRIAVLGVGSMGRNHARIYTELPNVELVGVADTNGENAQTIARRYSCRAYTDFRQLLDELRPDAVTVAVPTVYHQEVACAAAQRGAHLLIEKPIASSIAEGEAIIAAAEVANVKLMIGHVERFNPAIIALKEHLAHGELGTVFQLDARRQGPFPARVFDVGVVTDLAVHDLDIMRYVSGAEILRIYAETERHVHASHEDMMSGLLRLDNGAVGTLTINWLTPTKIRDFYIIGERGMFRVDYLTQDLFFFENAIADEDGWETLSILRGVNEGRMIRHLVHKKEPLRSELEAFVSMVRGEAPAVVSGADGLCALRLAQAILTSGRERRPVVLDLGF